MTLRLTRTVCCIPVIAALGLAGLAPCARSDGDPASDVLLEQRVFYPYAPATDPSFERRLDGATAAAARAGVPVKVALIASAVDLGAITQLWRRPQPYADYLGQEISFSSPQPLLVVMVNGYGTYSLTHRENAAIASLPLPAAPTGNALAAAALSAVRRIAAADGHPIAAGAVAPPSGSNTTALLVAVLALVALAIAGALAVATLRRARTPPPGRRRSRRSRR